VTILWPPFVGWMFFCSLLFRILSRTRVDKMTTFGKGIYALCAIAHTKMDFKPVHAFYILSTYNNLSKIIQDEK